MKQAYTDSDRPQGWTLQDKTEDRTPVLENDSARLWDLGDGIVCLELTTHMNTFNDDVFSLILRTLDKISEDFAGLVIGDDDQHFSAGLDLKLTLRLINDKDWNAISRLIRRGQTVTSALRYAPFPVVAAISGYAVGGGCETVLHCDGVQMHQETQIGLVEQKIGVVPSWGGCTEMLRRATETTDFDKLVDRIADIFTMISQSALSETTEEAVKNLSLDQTQISSDRTSLLPEAVQLCHTLADNYAAPAKPVMSLPGPAIKNRLVKQIDIAHEAGDINDFTKTLQMHLAAVLSGGFIPEEIANDLSLDPVLSEGSNDTAVYDVSEQDILDREHDSFMALIKTPDAKDRIRKVISK